MVTNGPRSHHSLAIWVQGKIMNPKESSSQTASRAPFEIKILSLLLLFWAYFCGNFGLRWLRWVLHIGHARNGWAPPDSVTLVYQVYMWCLPIALYAWLLYIVCLRFPRVFNRLTATLLVFALMVVVELDMSWFAMSRTHLTLDDAQIFLMGSPDDFGLERAELLGHLRRLLRHGMFLVILAFLSLPLTALLLRWQVLARLRISRRAFGAILIVLVLVDSVWVGYCTRNESGLYNPSQWGFVAYANPARTGLLDRLWRRLFADQPDLRLANEMLAATADPPLVATGSPSVDPARHGQRPLNVMMVVVESFNARVAAETDLPCLKKLRERSVRLERHYSTGNCTQLGLLGILYGAPPTFYDGGQAQARSPFVDRFVKLGYRCQRFSNALTAFRNLGNYICTFNTPDVENGEVKELIPAVAAALREPGPHFHFVFYAKTHYPYSHGPTFSCCVPEVPQDFHFQRWDAVNYSEAIVNRYKNSLLEFDAWLEDLLRQVDLDNTIIIVTGDHGEEFFETGRLGHCSCLNDPQTRVPCLLAIPGRKPETITRITSHADLMPTVADLLGWSNAVPCFGRSILGEEPTPTAVIAHHNQNHRSLVWAVVSEEHKTILEATGDDLQILALYGKDDRERRFSAAPESWASNFTAVRRFRRAWRKAVSGESVYAQAREPQQ